MDSAQEVYRENLLHYEESFWDGIFVPISRIHSSPHPILRAKIHPSNPINLGTISQDCQLHIYDIQTQKPSFHSYIPSIPHDFTWSLSPSICYTTSKNYILLHDLRKSQPVKYLSPSHVGGTTSFTLIDAYEAASAGADGTLHKYDLRSSKTLMIAPVHDLHISSVEYAHGYLYTAGVDAQVLQIHSDSFQVLHRITSGISFPSVWHALPHPTHKDLLLQVSPQSYPPVIWNLNSLQHVLLRTTKGEKTMPEGWGIGSRSVSYKGKATHGYVRGKGEIMEERSFGCWLGDLGVAGRATDVFLWRCRDGVPLLRLPNMHRALVRCVDGWGGGENIGEMRMVFSGDNDGEGILWQWMDINEAMQLGINVEKHIQQYASIPAGINGFSLV